MPACSAFYKKFVRPRVVTYFSAELEATEHFFYLAGVLPWAPGMTSATIGYTLWNRQHKDDDLALTVLVALGAPHGGGEFAHAEHGYAHAVRNDSPTAAVRRAERHEHRQRKVVVLVLTIP